MRTIAVAICSLWVSNAVGQAVSPAEMAAFKGGIEGGCVNAGLEKGDPPDRVRAFCSCVINTLGSSLTNEEWQKFYFHATRGQKPQEHEVLAPHMQKLKACRAR